MTNEIPAFQAKDAFTYVDLYRHLKVEGSAYVGKEKERMLERLWQTKDVPTHIWAQLRAHEHALDWIQHRREPGLVVLGETDTEGQPQAIGRVQKLESDLNTCREDKKHLIMQVEQFQKREQEWQAELSKRHLEAAGFKRRLNQTQSTFVVVGLTLLFVIGIQFAVMMSR